MTEEIKYNKDEKWIPYNELEETPQQTITRLEQENKELKEEINKYYQQTLDDEILMNELSLEVDLRKKESDFYLEKLSKYRSALEEIREICKCSKSPINCDECPQNNDCEELCVNDENLQDIIYDKINEVLNA